jgi:phosphate transport system substrate-binding protein
MRTSLWALPIVALLAACGSNQPAGTKASPGGAAITGAGSTFVYPVLSAWASDYATQTGTKVNYQSIGSGGGVSQVKAGTVDFGATDQPLAADELAKSKLAQFPVVIGGIVAVVNLSGAEPGKLRLTGPVLADIYAGKIKTWNDPAIVRVNPGMSLPSAAIAVVHRSDGSGTTFNFTHYLSQVSPTWKASPGEGKTVAWPTGVGGKGNEGVAGYVKQIPNSIGYVEYAYALQGGMTYAALQNAAGSFVTPSAETFSNAAASADWARARDFDLVMTNAPGANAYPITATTFVLMPTVPTD